MMKMFAKMQQIVKLIGCDNIEIDERVRLIFCRVSVRLMKPTLNKKKRVTLARNTGNSHYSHIPPYI